MSFTQTRQEQFYSACLTENYRQVEIWGLQEHDVGYWLGILVEEVGEVAKAMIEETPDDGCDLDQRRERIIKELVEVAAVAASFAADTSWSRR